MAIDLTTKRILVVDGHALMRQTIKHIMGLCGAKLIVEADSGVNALAAMRLNKFDIVFCDYTFPADKNGSTGKNGQQVLEEARHLKLLPLNSVFIMVTGEQSSAMVLSAIDNKPDSYLIKPFSQKELLARIEKCQARKQYFASIENEMDNGNLYQAIYHCEKLLQADNNKMRPQLLKMRAELALQIGDINTAEEIYQDILQGTEPPWAQLGLGVVAFFRGQDDQAIDIFQGLIDRQPFMLEAYDWLVKTYESLGDHEPAVSTLDAAVTISPASILRQKKLGLLADKVDNLPFAKKAYIAAIKLGINSMHRSSNDYSGLANIHLKSNEPDKALSLVHTLEKVFQHDPEAKLRSTLLEHGVHQTYGNHEQSQKAYEKAFDLNGRHSKQLSKELRLEMAMVIYQNGNKEACDAILSDLIKANMDNKLFIKDLVAICDATINKNHAKTLIQEVQKELTDINNKGVCLFKDGDIAGALAIFDQAIAIMPNNHTIILNILKIIIHDLKTNKPDTKKVAKAQSFIKKAIEIRMPHKQVHELQAVLNTIVTRP